MSRIYKFRAWDKKKKGMYNIFAAPSSNLALWWKGTNEDGYVIMDLIEMEVMQFTGLLDKQGKEIYEGDIIEDRGIYCGVVCYGRYKTKRQHKHDCITHHIGWYLKNDINNISLLDTKFALIENYTVEEKDWLEVIGNLHENPKLVVNK